MAKVNLIIADIDEAYVRGLVSYVNLHHFSTFSVSCFTKHDVYISHMEHQPSIDVLLVGPEFYNLTVSHPNIRLKVMLSSSPLKEEQPGLQLINRFNTGEKLIGELVHMYSRLDPSEIGFSSDQKDTRFIGVYSPSGGTGKTTIAAALAMQCRELGMKAFYLNLEAISSMAMFFNAGSKRNLSYVFYYLKEKSSNLSFRMEGIKTTDPDNGVDYFSPSESPMEYEELEPDELTELLQGIRGMNSYDYIFIDMPSTFDKKNLRIMEICDRIILIEVPGQASHIKKQVLLKELARHASGCDTTISERLVEVLNRYKGSWTEGTGHRIPEYSRTLLKEDGCLAIDDEDFQKAVNQLMRILTNK